MRIKANQATFEVAGIQSDEQMTRLAATALYCGLDIRTRRTERSEPGLGRNATVIVPEGMNGDRMAVAFLRLTAEINGRSLDQQLEQVRQVINDPEYRVHDVFPEIKVDDGKERSDPRTSVYNT